MKNLENYGVLEMNANETNKIEGGTETPWWYYLVAPGTAYIVDKFLEGYSNGCECN